MRGLVGCHLFCIAFLGAFAAASNIPVNRDSLEAALQGNLPDSTRVDVLIALHKALASNDMMAADEYL